MPEEGQERVYAVPRANHCLSEKMIDFINYFGNEKGFEMLLDVLENGKVNDGLSFKVIENMSVLISLPCSIYHKAFIADFGARICNAIKARMAEFYEKGNNSYSKEQIDDILKVLGSLQDRIMNKEESEAELDILKVEIYAKCIKPVLEQSNNCPGCTFVNAKDALKCEICETPLAKELEPVFKVKPPGGCRDCLFGNCKKCADVALLKKDAG